MNAEPKKAAEQPRPSLRKALKGAPQRLWRLIYHNWPWKLLALFLALCLWAGLITQDPTLTRERVFTDVTVSVVGADTSNDVFLTDYIKYLMTLPENKDGLCVLSETGRIKAINTGYTATQYDATVSLLDSEGNPAAGAWAKVEIDGKAFGEYAADENGVITVSGIGNGLHDLCAIAEDGSRAANYVSDYAGQKSITLQANYTVVNQGGGSDNDPVTTPDDGKEKGDSVNTGDSTGSLIAFSALAISGLAALSLKKRKH